MPFPCHQNGIRMSFCGGQNDYQNRCVPFWAFKNHYEMPSATKSRFLTFSDDAKTTTRIDVEYEIAKTDFVKTFDGNCGHTPACLRESTIATMHWKSNMRWCAGARAVRPGVHVQSAPGCAPHPTPCPRPRPEPRPPRAWLLQQSRRPDREHR